MRNDNTRGRHDQARREPPKPLDINELRALGNKMRADMARGQAEREQRWTCIRSLPGAEEPAGTISGHPATRAAHWNLAVMEAWLAANARAGRDALRMQARIIRRMYREVAELRELTQQQAGRPQSATGVARFRDLVEEACVAIERAAAAIPVSAPAGKAQRDDLDAAPSVGRLPGSTAAALRAAGLPVTGANLRDLMIATGLEPVPSDNVDNEAVRKKYDEAARRSRSARSRRVAGTKRRKK